MATTLQIHRPTVSSIALNKHNVVIFPDYNGLGINQNVTMFDILSGKVKGVMNGVNEDVGSCEISFPNKKFGTRIPFCIPIVVCSDTLANVIMRGFITDEIGKLTSNEDCLSVVAYDYKWFFSRIGKIRGKIYTVDTDIVPRTLSLLYNIQGKPFQDPSLAQRFKYEVPGGNRLITEEMAMERTNGYGFIGTEKTIFNENGEPNCASEDSRSNSACAFKFKAENFYREFLGYSGNDRNNDFFYYWTYASIIRYICKH